MIQLALLLWVFLLVGVIHELPLQVRYTPAAVPAGTRAELAATGQLALNDATPDALQALPRLGPKTAAAIIAYRDAHGPFTSPAGLIRVPGLGPGTLKRVQSYLH